MAIETKESRIFGLDLARCIAISAVFLTHSIQIIFSSIKIPYVWYFAQGGVELFFSLSGFLIGNILLKDFSAPTIRIGLIPEFWIRRWLRTLPLYFITYFGCLLFYNLFIVHVNFDVRYLLFLQNLSTEIDFLKISWSLTIEEWTYFLLPLIIFAFYSAFYLLSPRINETAAFLTTALILIITMTIFRQVCFTGKSQMRLIIYRMDATAYGLVAAWISTRKFRINNTNAILIIVIGLCLWIFAALLIEVPGGYLKTVYYPICGTATAVVVLGLYYYSFKKPVSFIVHLSKISYSVYLTHLYLVLFPLAWFSKGLNNFYLGLTCLCSVGLAIIIGSISFKYLEQPFLRIREKLPMYAGHRKIRN